MRGSPSCWDSAERPTRHPADWQTWRSRVRSRHRHGQFAKHHCLDRILGRGWPLRARRSSSIQSKFSVANRRPMKSLISCQNEASRGLSSASRLTALSSSSSAARCAARFVPTGVRKSRILSSAVSSLFASDDRARARKASMHVSRRVLMTRLNDTYSSRTYFTYAPKFFLTKNCARCRAFIGSCRYAKGHRFDLRFFRPFRADLLIRKSSSFLPRFIAATSQRGLAPRPAHVSPDGPRYFGGTFLPFKTLLPPRATTLRPPTRTSIFSNCFSS